MTTVPSGSVRRHYERPPLQEAVAEFRFRPSGEWDQTVPGLIYGEVRDTFPHKQPVIAADVRLEGKGIALTQIAAQVERLQLRHADGHSLLTVGQHYLSISKLPPYESWEEFQPLIHRALEVYADVARPEAIDRIGLRYVNRIELPVAEGGIDLSDYFDFYPYVGDRLPQAHGSFISGIQLPYEDLRDLMRVQLADAEGSGANTLVAVLDIDYFLSRAGAVALDGCREWLQVAHDRVEEIFEGCLSDTLREHFGVLPD